MSHTSRHSAGEPLPGRRKGRPADTAASSAHAYERVEASASDRGAPAVVSGGHDDTDTSNVKYILRELEADYGSNANPVHALEAYAVARRAGIDPPNWSLAFLDGAVAGLLKIRDEVADGTPVKREADRIRKAFGFGGNGPGRGKSSLGEAGLLKRYRGIYFEVRREITGGTKLDFAYYAVAQARGISTPTVRRAYKRIKNKQ